MQTSTTAKAEMEISRDKLRAITLQPDLFAFYLRSALGGCQGDAKSLERRFGVTIKVDA